MSRAILLGACLSVIFLCHAVAADTTKDAPAATQGKTYYVDFASGKDANSGAAQDSPWQHCPGDSAAADLAKTTALAPGDTVLFKGGVIYRGNIVVRESGAEGKQITYDGNTDGQFGTGRAIVDGSEPLTGWQKCASAEECDGNPNWQNLWWAEVPYPITDPRCANLYDDQNPLNVAHDPICKYPWEPDFTSEFLVFDPSKATTTSIQDEKVLTQTRPDAWAGAYFSVRTPDAWFYYKITGFDPAAHQITFKENEAVFKGRKGPHGESGYLLLNALAILKAPGQYVARTDGPKTKFFLWPWQAGAAPSAITITRRQIGFNINGQSNLTIAGFWIRKFVNFGNHESGTAILDDDNKPNGGSIIRDNLITGCTRTLSSGKTAAISLSGLKGSLVANNQICHNHGSVGIRVLKGAGHVIKNNLVSDCGGVGILLWQDSKNCQIIGNTVRDNTAENYGSHSPVGMLLYKGCANILIFGNTVVNNGQRPLALYSPDGDITIAGNVFRHQVGLALEGFGPIRNVKVLNNVLICDDPQGKIFQGGFKCEAHNNIFVTDGRTLDRGPGVKLDDAHNLCAAVAQLGTIFVDPAHGDYRLKKGSPAIGVGVATEIKEDAAGRPFAPDKPDVGAFAYVEK